jgi:hypothetical protein
MKSTILLITFLVSLECPAQDSRTAEAAGRAVEMAVVKADDLSPAKWPAQGIDLKQLPTIVKDGTNLYMLLRANNIAPDSEAFALVYDMNPRLTDANNLVPGTSLILPAVTARSSLAEFLPDGELVELTLDPVIRSDLEERIDALQAILPAVDGLTTDIDLTNEIKGLITWFKQIEKRLKRRTAPPLRQASLIQLKDEAAMLDSILLEARQGHKDISATERSQIADLYEDVAVEMRRFDETLGGAAPLAEPIYEVTVNIKGADLSILDKLRVYYTYNGLFRNPPSEPPITSYGFDELGSGKSKTLQMKSYRIWVAKDGDPNHPIGPPHLLRIEHTSPASISVGLSLNAGVSQ